MGAKRVERCVSRRGSVLIDSRGSYFLYWVKILLPQGEPFFCGGLVLIGKAADLKSAGRKPLGVRVPRPPPEKWIEERRGEVAERLKATAC